MKYCMECGAELVLKECINFGLNEGEIPFCPVCSEFRFPMFNVAVSTIIFNKDFSKTLLIQQYGRKNNILVAGYVTKGENLAEALKREIKEETGLDVIDTKFNDSEYFEKSNSLICNFITRVGSEDFKLTEEVDYAAWYDLNTAKEVIYHNGLAESFLLKALEKIPQYVLR